MARRRPFSELMVPALLAATLLLSATIISRRTPFWYDEIATWVEVTDPSLRHMLRSISDGAESAPPLYHLLAWCWSRLFGTSETALRLFTATGFAAAAATAWLTLRRPFGRFGATVATAAAIGGSELLLDLNRQARFYGLFMFETAAIVYLMARVARRGPSPQLGAALFAAHAALLYTHIFGIVYSAALGAALLCWDLVVARRPRLLTSGAVALAWVAFLPWIPSFQRQMEVAKPSLWIPRAGIHALLVSSQFGIVLLPLCVALLGGLYMLGTRAAPIPHSSSASASSVTVDGEEQVRRALLITGAVLLLVPLGIWLMQFLTSPVFVPRYMIPSALGLAIALAAVAQRAAEGVPREPLWRYRAALATKGALLLTLVGFPLYYAAAFPARERQDRQLAAASTHVPPGTPVVAELIVDFGPLWFYQGRLPGKVYFLDDSASAALPGNAAGGLSAIKSGRTYARNGYFPGVLVPPDTVFRRHTRFLVIDQPHINWFEQRIAPDARFRSCLVGYYQEIPLRLVTRAGDPVCDSLDVNVAAVRTLPAAPR